MNIYFTRVRTRRKGNNNQSHPVGVVVAGHRPSEVVVGAEQRNSQQVLKEKKN